jgi:hypothetical protein
MFSLFEGMFWKEELASFVREITSQRCIPVNHLSPVACFGNTVVQRQGRTCGRQKGRGGAGGGFWATQIEELASVFVLFFSLPSQELFARLWSGALVRCLAFLEYQYMYFVHG